MRPMTPPVTATMVPASPPIIEPTTSPAAPTAIQATFRRSPPRRCSIAPSRLRGFTVFIGVIASEEWPYTTLRSSNWLSSAVVQAPHDPSGCALYLFKRRQDVGGENPSPPVSTQLYAYFGSSNGRMAFATFSGRNESIITASSFVCVCPMLPS